METPDALLTERGTSELFHCWALSLGNHQHAVLSHLKIASTLESLINDADDSDSSDGAIEQALEEEMKELRKFVLPSGVIVNGVITVQGTTTDLQNGVKYDRFIDVLKRVAKERQDVFARKPTQIIIPRSFRPYMQEIDVRRHSTR